MRLTVGITGIGGDIGLGILSSLKQSKYRNSRTIGMDINPYSVGLYRVNKGYIVPGASSPEYLSKIIKICNKERIDALFVSTEQELSCLSENREMFKDKTKTKLIIADKNIIDIGLDKWKTYQFLEKNSFLYPQSVLLKNNAKAVEEFIKKFGFPLIIKPRYGRGSKNLHLVKNFEELNFFGQKIDQPIMQEYLEPSTEEYTCGVFALKNKVFSIIFKRELNFGLTAKAIVWKDKEIETVCKKICQRLGLEGPINIQLRKTKKGAVPFEINPRYSSTVSIRNYLGFRDVEWAIDAFVFRKSGIKYHPPKKGKVILRYFEDFYPKKIVKSAAKFHNL